MRGTVIVEPLDVVMHITDLRFERDELIITARVNGPVSKLQHERHWVRVHSPTGETVLRACVGPFGWPRLSEYDTITMHQPLRVLDGGNVYGAA